MKTDEIKNKALKEMLDANEEKYRAIAKFENAKREFESEFLSCEGYEHFLKYYGLDLDETCCNMRGFRFYEESDDKVSMEWLDSFRGESTWYETDKIPVKELDDFMCGDGKMKEYIKKLKEKEKKEKEEEEKAEKAYRKRLYEQLKKEFE